MLIADVLAKKGNTVFKILASKTVMDAIVGMTSFKVGAVLVVDNSDTVLGIFTERDVTRIFSAGTVAPLETTVGTHMTANPISCSQSDSVAKVLGTMSKHHFRHMPVYENDSLVGIVSIRDLVLEQIERVELESETEALRTYVTPN